MKVGDGGLAEFKFIELLSNAFNRLKLAFRMEEAGIWAKFIQPSTCLEMH